MSSEFFKGMYAGALPKLALVLLHQESQVRFKLLLLLRTVVSTQTFREFLIEAVRISATAQCALLRHPQI
jgi:hypothetical protein